MPATRKKSKTFERKADAQRWLDEITAGMVTGRYVDPRAGKVTLEPVGVEPTRENGMHALRHYYASTLLEGGGSIRALADYLGHSDPGFTLRVYAHLMPESEERARTVADMSLSAAAESSRNDGPGHAGFVN